MSSAARGRGISALLVIATLSGLAMVPCATADSEKGSQSITVHAHFETSPDRVDMMSPCSPSMPVPKQQSCRGTASSTKPEVITGSWQGQSEYAYGFSVFPSGVSYGAGVDHFSGTIAGCGTGSISYRQHYNSDDKGDFHGQWQMFGSSGTGDLAGLRGAGTYMGISRADGSTSGDYNGTVFCKRH